MNRQSYTFLGSFVFLSSYPLYEVSLGTTHELLLIPVTKAFQRLQKAPLNTPAFHLPELSPLFSLYINEKDGFPLEVLGHQLGPSFIPVVYLSTKARYNHPWMGTLYSYLSSHGTRYLSVKN